MEEMTDPELLMAYVVARDKAMTSWPHDRADQQASDDLCAAVLARMGPPPGWKLVPEVPTEEMKRASRLTHELEPGNDVSRITMWGCNAWDAMLAAAPEPPTAWPGPDGAGETPPPPRDGKEGAMPGDLPRLTPEHIPGLDLAVRVAIGASKRRIPASDGTVIVLPASVDDVLDALIALRDRAEMETAHAPVP